MDYLVLDGASLQEGGGARGFYDVGVSVMWTTPVVTEIAVGLEINCYACADL